MNKEKIITSCIIISHLKNDRKGDFMKKKIFNLAFILAIVGTVFYTGLSVSAKEPEIKTETITYENQDNSISSGNYNVTVINPNGFILDGTSKPTQSHNLNNGQMNFHGNSANTILYTNKYFYGKSRPKIVIKAVWHDMKAEVYAKDSNTPVTTITTKSNYTTETQLIDVNTSTKFYIKFYNPCYFEGHVE